MKKIAATFALLTVLAACGGGRPSADQIAGALKDPDHQLSAITNDALDEAIDCVAEAFYDSDLSDEALQALVDGDAEGEAGVVKEAVAGLADEMTACLSA